MRADDAASPEPLPEPAGDLPPPGRPPRTVLGTAAPPPGPPADLALVVDGEPPPPAPRRQDGVGIGVALSLGSAGALLAACLDASHGPAGLVVGSAYVILGAVLGLLVVRHGQPPRPPRPRTPADDDPRWRPRAPAPAAPAR